MLCVDQRLPTLPAGEARFFARRSRAARGRGTPSVRREEESGAVEHRSWRGRRALLPVGPEAELTFRIRSRSKEDSSSSSRSSAARLIQEAEKAEVLPHGHVPGKRGVNGGEFVRQALSPVPDDVAPSIRSTPEVGERTRGTC